MEDGIVALWQDEFAEYFLARESGYLKLYINNGLQFNEEDEYRYHHSVFVLPALCVNKPYRDTRVLVLGGGDGLGARDLIKLGIPPENIDLVDISEFMIFLCSKHPEITKLNHNSLKQINVIIDDGYEYVKKAKKEGKVYDLIILDYPDPSWEADNPVNRLFSQEHYGEVLEIVAPDGIVALQATSVVVSPNVFRKLQLIAEDLGVNHISARINIPSFKDIGVMIMSQNGSEIAVQKEIPPWVFFDEKSLQTLFFLHDDEKANMPDKMLKEMRIHEIVYYDLFVRTEGRGLPDFIQEDIAKAKVEGKDFSKLREALMKGRRQGLFGVRQAEL